MLSHTHYVATYSVSELDIWTKHTVTIVHLKCAIHSISVYSIHGDVYSVYPQVAINFKPVKAVDDQLPDPKGLSIIEIPSAAIALAESTVCSVIVTSSTRGPYLHLTPGHTCLYLWYPRTIEITTNE